MRKKNNFCLIKLTESVLRINSILMRIRILGPPWKNESKAVSGYLIFCPLNPDPHILADPGPDPGSQNVVDQTDPDPEH